MRVNVLAAPAMALAGFAAPSFAHTEIYTTTLSGPAEAPPNVSGNWHGESYGRPGSADDACRSKF